MAVRYPALLVALLCATSTAKAQTSMDERRLPESTALAGELRGLQDELGSTAGRLDSAKRQVKSARGKVRDAVTLVRLIRATDGRLGRIIRELKSASALPPLRAARPMVKSLEHAKKLIHDIRKKADHAEKRVLKPLDAELAKAERGLSLALTQCRATSAQAGLSAGALIASQHALRLAGYPRRPVIELERASAEVSPAVGALRRGLAACNRATAQAEGQARKMAASLNPLLAVTHHVRTFEKSLKPADDVARHLDKVLSTRVGVKMFGKFFGFTVRQVIEGPDKVAKAVLKPLKKLADKALGGVKGKFTVRVKLPGELGKLPAKFDRASAELGRLMGLTRGIDFALHARAMAGLRESLKRMPTR